MSNAIPSRPSAVEAQYLSFPPTGNRKPSSPYVHLIGARPSDAGRPALRLGMACDRRRAPTIANTTPCRIAMGDPSSRIRRARFRTDRREPGRAHVHHADAPAAIPVPIALGRTRPAMASAAAARRASRCCRQRPQPRPTSGPSPLLAPGPKNPYSSGVCGNCTRAGLA